MEASTFTCSICGEVSRDICLFCTKDACNNHLCERCRLCSDCCACDMPVFNQPVEAGGANEHVFVMSELPHSTPPAELPE